MQPGDIISHYRVIERLGGGGMGVVYLAEDLSLEREVALKFLSRPAHADEAIVKRFRQEAITASALEHPNICTIYEIGEVDGGQSAGYGGVFIAMAYYSGQTIRHRLDSAKAEGRTVAAVEAVGIVRQVAAGLAAAHAKGIIHRDVKPENIAVTNSGRAVILDFGIAKLSGGTRLTAENATLGTVFYMAPEQVRGEPVDGRTDQWSLAVVAAELLTGERPFRGDYDQAVIYGILNEEPSGLDGLDERVGTVLRRALSKSPSERYESIEDFSAAFAGAEEQAVDGIPARSRPAVLLVAAFTVALVATLIVWSSYGPGRGLRGDLGAGIGAATASYQQLTAASELEEFPALSFDGNRIVFSRETDGYRHLFVRDLESGSERQLTDEPRDDIQASWSPDGNSVVFVRATDPSGKIEPGDIFGAYSGGDVWKVDASSGRGRRILEQAFNPAFSPDGSRLVFDAAWAGDAQRIWMADSEGRNPEQLTADSSEDTDHIRPRWSDDARYVVFQNQRRTKRDIEIIDVRSRTVRLLTDDAYQNVGPVFAGRGRGIVFSSDRSGGMNLWYLPLDESGAPASAARQLSTGAGSDVQVASSADGGRLVYSVLGINADLWTLGLDPVVGKVTSPPVALVSSTREDSRGSWSSDDSTIAFNSDRTGEMNIWLFDVDRGATRQLTSGPGGDYQPFWSPKDTTLVFFSTRAGNPDIWTVDVASGELSQLTSEESVDVNPCFSPDGMHIAFLSDRGGRREVWVMRSDGRDQRPLTSVGAGGHFLRWTPDAKRVVFASDGVARTVGLDASEPETLVNVQGGSHMSFSPDFRMIADVVGHKVVWITPLDGRQPFATYGFDDLDVRIDYPVWSNDGRRLLFDRVKPSGGDIWMVDLFPGDETDLPS